MTLVLRAQGAAFTEYNGWSSDYAVRTGLVGEYYFGSDDSGVGNRAGTPDLQLVGAPTVNSRSFVGSQADGYDTTLAEQEQYTFVAVAKRHNVQGAMVSNFTTTGNYGSLWHQSTGSVVSQIGLSGGVNTVSLAMPGSVGDVCFFALRVGATNQKIFAGRGNVLTSATSATFASARQTKPQTLRVGSHYYAGLVTGSTEIYAAAIHTQALSDADISAVYQAMRTRYASLGVTGL